MPAKKPDRAPRRMTRISTWVPGGSVAGEAEEVPRVMHPLVDHHGLAEHRGHALVDADEVMDRDSEEHGDAEEECDPAAAESRVGRASDAYWRCHSARKCLSSGEPPSGIVRP